MSSYTRAELAHFACIKEMPCSLCGAPAPSDAHHILEGRTPGRKSPTYTAIPLCKNCHQGSIDGIHGQQAMWRVMRKTELQCLSETIAILLECTR